MAGITNNAFRNICVKFGSGMVCSEMISDVGIVRLNKKTNEMLKYSKKQKPISIQLFGNDPTEMANAAIYIVKNFHPDIIDINCGCPARKVAISKNAGSSLLKTPNLIFEITKAVVNAISVPVTVKIRSGWDEKHINCIEVAKLIEKAGASAIIIHPRTRKQEFSGMSDWSLIKQVKQNVSIPVIGNGDVKSCYDAKKMLDMTWCDGVMIGRECIGNPWIFKQCNEYLEKNKSPTNISMKERIKVLLFHIKLLKKYYGKYKAVLLIRTHLSRYFLFVPNHKVLVKTIMLENSYEKIIKILKKQI
ncbi:MAG: tRNA dihydrouridine synthase DusB [Mycoplasmoidaceae bacterium]|nr:MAG: tRNA dihydrouridine synthase DusB [Mycoplasmoidaceae bacterium]